MEQAIKNDDANELYQGTHEEILKEYGKLASSLYDKGGRDADGELFEQVTDVGRDILRRGGLPTSDDCLSVLWGMTVEPQEKVENPSEKSRLVILIENIINDPTSPDIFPQLDIKPHPYAYFLYFGARYRKDPERLLSLLDDAEHHLNDVDVLESLLVKLHDKVPDMYLLVRYVNDPKKLYSLVENNESHLKDMKALVSQIEKLRDRIPDVGFFMDGALHDIKIMYS